MVVAVVAVAVIVAAAVIVAVVVVVAVAVVAVVVVSVADVVTVAGEVEVAGAADVVVVVTLSATATGLLPESVDGRVVRILGPSRGANLVTQVVAVVVVKGTGAPGNRMSMSNG